MAEGVIHVVVVDDHEVFGAGTMRLLADDRRLRFVGTVTRVADLAGHGLSFDVCVLDLIGVGTADEIVRLMRTVPAVVCTAAADWRTWVAAWVCGARAVLGKDVGPAQLADAIWDAEHRPHDVKPQLAQALLDAVERVELPVPPYLLDLFTQVTAGGRVPKVLARLGVDQDRYATDLESFRLACGRAGLGELEVLTPTDSRAGLPPTTARAAVAAPESSILSSRELEILTELASGYAPAEIGERLHVSASTVKSHIMSAMEKFAITRGRESAVQLLFAVYMTGRHPDPDVLRRRLYELRAQ